MLYNKHMSTGPTEQGRCYHHHDKSEKNLGQKTKTFRGNKELKGITKSCWGNILRNDLFLGITEENQIKKPDNFTALAKNDINVAPSFYSISYAKVTVKPYMIITSHFNFFCQKIKFSPTPNQPLPASRTALDAHQQALATDSSNFRNPIHYYPIDNYGKTVDDSCFWVYSLIEPLIHTNEYLLKT